MGIFSVVPPTEPCALRSTQPLKVSTRDFSWDKGGRCVRLTTYHNCSAETSRKSGALIYPEPLGPPRPVAGHLYFTYPRISLTYCLFKDYLHYVFFYLHLLLSTRVLPPGYVTGLSSLCLARHVSCSACSYYQNLRILFLFSD